MLNDKNAKGRVMAQTKKQLFLEIVRFLLVGGGATLVDYLVFWVFDGVLFPLLPMQTSGWQTAYLIVATALGFLVGLCINWVLSVAFVFKQTKEKTDVRSKKDFSTFAIIGVLGLAITEIGVVALVWILPEIFLFQTFTFMGVAWKKWIAKAVMTGLVLVWNYLGRKLFIFKS